MRYEQLAELIRQDYQLRERRSVPRLETALRHLAESFAGMRALDITPDKLVAYEVRRRGQGAAPASVKYEFSALRRAFNLALVSQFLPRAPKIPTVSVSNARQGFFEDGELEALCKELPDYLVPVARFASFTGWRRSEIVGLTWSRVDFEAGIVRLDVGTTKNKAGRVFPMDALPALVKLLQGQRNYTDVQEIMVGHPIALVFHRQGKPLRDNYYAWRTACERAKLGGKLLHDLRRTAARNLVRAGVPERTAMELCGHKTRAIFDRYNIVNEADLRAGVEKLARSFTVHAQSAE